MSNFKNADEQERIGREKTIQLFGDKIELTPSFNRYDRHDLSGSTVGKLGTKNTDFYIEVKNRNIESTKYKYDCLEYEKFRALIEIDGGNADHYYICHFTDNISRLYQLDNLKLADLHIEVDTFPETMAQEGYKEKLMIFLPVNLAKPFKQK